ncbi:hypothetical protein APHAL10511_002049 [Amanita phalloides]|nr:hypothetical protein APHAL10511_002049 [Amanita phalloides]
MLRASSQGLSLPLLIARVRRRADFPPLDITISIRRQATWDSNPPILLGSGVQSAKGKAHDERKGHVQSARHDREQKMEECTFSAALQFNVKLSALSNRRVYDAKTPIVSQGLAPQIPHIGIDVDPFSEEFAASYPSAPLPSHPVRKLIWNRKYNAQKRYSLEYCQVANISPDVLHTTAEDTGVTGARDKLLYVLESTVNPFEAWDAYTTLSHMKYDGHDAEDEAIIPFAHLHRLCRLLSRYRPKTHVQFLRLLSVLNSIRSMGGRIHLHEWNTIIDHAAKGWRKTQPEDMDTALSLYNDMINGLPPGATLNGKVQVSEDDRLHKLRPDIYTFNSLLNIAVEITEASAVRHAMTLMNAAGISPNRITFSTLLKYYGRLQQMSGVRSTILRMREQGHELGLDGINACIWIYGQNGHYELVKSVYQLLRHNAMQDEAQTDCDILSLARHLEEEEYIRVPADVIPDGTTFAVVIQIMAYHGDLFNTLRVFVDTLAFLPSHVDAQTLRKGENRQVTTMLMNTIFRAIFLGFSRHGIPPLQDDKSLPPRLRMSNPPGRPHWSLQNLQTVFDTFVSSPGEIKASRSTLHWIMHAFDITSGQDDVVLRGVWKKLDERFGMRWIAPTNRLAAWKRRLFSEMSDEPVHEGSLEDDAPVF